MTLQKIQSELKAPKGQTNKFAKYQFRSAEDVLEAVKPILEKYEAFLTLSDEIIVKGEGQAETIVETTKTLNSETTKTTTRTGQRFYLKVTARLTIKLADDKFIDHVVTAEAREAENKKGMDASQVSGSTSSYARKYALNGLFAIDDTEDSDTTNDHGKKAPEEKPKPEFTQKRLDDFVKWAEGAKEDEVTKRLLQVKNEMKFTKNIEGQIDLYLNELTQGQKKQT